MIICRVCDNYHPQYTCTDIVTLTNPTGSVHKPFNIFSSVNKCYLFHNCWLTAGSWLYGGEVVVSSWSGHFWGLVYIWEWGCELLQASNLTWLTHVNFLKFPHVLHITTCLSDQHICIHFIIAQTLANIILTHLSIQRVSTPWPLYMIY